jgi:hypothetical protein
MLQASSRQQLQMQQHLLQHLLRHLHPHPWMLGQLPPLLPLQRRRRPHQQPWLLPQQQLRQARPSRSQR